MQILGVELFALLFTIILFIDRQRFKKVEAAQVLAFVEPLLLAYILYISVAIVHRLTQLNLIALSAEAFSMLARLQLFTLTLFIFTWMVHIQKKLSKPSHTVFLLSIEGSIFVMLLVLLMWPTLTLSLLEYITIFASLLFLLVTSLTLIQRWSRLTRPINIILLLSLFIVGCSLIYWALLADTLLFTVSNAFMLALSYLFLQRLRLNINTLTELPNQTAFLLYLEQLVKNDELATLIVADIENFRRINQRYGVPIGDVILKEFALFLRTLRKNYQAYHLSGNRFVLVGPLASHNEVVRIVHQIQGRAAQGLITDNRSISFHVNIAIVEVPNHAFLRGRILEVIDFTLTEIKARRRQSVIIYNHKMELLQQRRLDVLTAVRRAIKNDNRIAIQYQPIYSVDTSQLWAAEALMRLEDPLLGSLSPDEFIRAAEEAGLISSLTQVMTNKVARFISKNAALATRLDYISINISADDVATLESTKKLVTILEQHKLDIEKVGFEITESMLIDNEKDASAIWDLLAAHKIKIILDDFGTGFSNLEALARVPFEIVKIDRSLLANLGKSRNLVIFIATFLHQLGKSIVAEGVETEAQLDFIRENQLTLAQGYYFSRPLSEDDFLNLLKEHSQLSLTS